MNYFKYSVNGRLYFVNFRHYVTNRPRTKCWIYDYDLERIFIGTAKLNITEGDTYDEKLGESLSFERALLKRDSTLEKLKISVPKMIEDQKERDKNSLIKKFKREQDKYLNTVIEQEKPSVIAFPLKKVDEANEM